MKKDLSFSKLQKLYIEKCHSVPEIAKKLGCSDHKVNYWLSKHKIKKRTISEAIYLKCNPNGDPFEFTPPRTSEELKLFWLGLGIYWGEGDKSGNNTSVRMGNTDPILLKKFREFLIKIYKVKRKKIKYSLILFNDANEEEAVRFWKKHLNVRREQLGKIIIIPPQGKGTYKKKSKYGVFLVIVSNKKLKEHVLGEIKKIY